MFAPYTEMIEKILFYDAKMDMACRDRYIDENGKHGYVQNDGHDEHGKPK
jgi:hypothetical protein